MKKKRIITVILATIILLMGLKGILIYRDYRAEQERLSQSPYFTKYKLTTTEMGVLDAKYHIEVTPTVENIKKEDWPDYSYYTIEATEDTEVVVAVLNNWLFDDRSEMDQGAWEKAKEYGITTDNRLTSGWVMEHPRKAVEIMTSLGDEGDIFRYLKKRIYPMYEKITGEKLDNN